jgi:hypothetical protein
MIKIEKILCFIFTLFVLYLVNKQCSIENLINYNSFNDCSDDPNWYTIGNNGIKYYCKDIGTSASCYDMDPLQQEGWEKCLNTCGNCSNTKVTISPMNILALNSGDTGENFDRYNIDDSRKWIGLDIGEQENIDVRQSLTRDETDDIVDIYDRLNIVEDMYDMLLSSVSSCIDCSQYSSNNCPSNYCEVQNDVCIIKESSNSGTFRSCNGDELTCEYTVEQSNNDEESDSTIENVDGSLVTHTYVKHYCDEHGVCSILFPTYDISCESIPIPSDAEREHTTITYQPRPYSPRKCLSENYFNTNEYIENNITPSQSPSGHECIIESIEPRVITQVENTNKINIETGESWNDNQIATLTNNEDLDDTSNYSCEQFNNITVRVNDDNTLTLLSDNSEELNDISELVNNCKISREESIKEKCYHLNDSQIDLNDSMVEKTNCASYCNNISPTTQYITVNNNECRCYSEQPSIGDYVISQDGECLDEYYITFLNEGRSVNTETIPVANSNPNEQIRNMCKNYFLLETSLDNETDTGAITGMSGRVSLYDVCPTQCKAVGCV